MPKRQSFEPMKYLPIAIIFFAATGAWFSLKNSNASQDEEINDLQQQVETQEKMYYQINISQVQLQSKVDQSFQILQDIKDNMKEFNSQ